MDQKRLTCGCRFAPRMNGRKPLAVGRLSFHGPKRSSEPRGDEGESGNLGKSQCDPLGGKLSHPVDAGGVAGLALVDRLAGLENCAVNRTAARW